MPITYATVSGGSLAHAEKNLGCGRFSKFSRSTKYAWTKKFFLLGLRVFGRARKLSKIGRGANFSMHVQGPPPPPPPLTVRMLRLYSRVGPV